MTRADLRPHGFEAHEREGGRNGIAVELAPAAESIRFRLNGVSVAVSVPADLLLAHLLRDRLGLHGTKISCDAEVCGACTVLVDGRPVSSCCYLAVDAHERDVLTVEGARDLPEFARIEKAFISHSAVQCGFCTPGFVMMMVYLLKRKGAGLPCDLASLLSGNICRCTGYRSLLAAASEILTAGDGDP